MFRKGKLFVLLALFTLLLTGCNQPVELQTDDGFLAAKKVFEANNKRATETVGTIKFYKPAGMKVDKQSTSETVILTSKTDSFYLTVNPNEKKDSRYHFDVLFTGEPVDLIGAQTFTKDDAFGFVAVLKQSEQKVELIAGVGGAKVQVVTDEKHIASYLEKMMAIVRSVEEQQK